MRRSPEQELEIFLSSVHPLQRKQLERGFSALTSEEIQEWQKLPDKTAEYETIIRRIPAKWAEYQERKQKEGDVFLRQLGLVPGSNPEGRPREEIYDQAAKLRRQGKSIRFICQTLVPEYANVPSTEKRKIRDRVDKAIRYRVGRETC